MKILFIIHFCSPEINDNAHIPIYLGSAGHEVLVISSRHAKSLKGDVYSDEVEEYQGVKFYRPYKEWRDITNNPFDEWDKVVKEVDKFKPDVLVGFGEFNSSLALRISKKYEIPYHLFMEYLSLNKVTFPMRGRTLLKTYLPWLHDYFSRQFLKKLSKDLASIMFSYYGDIKNIPEIKQLGADAYYVPWCTDSGLEEVNLDGERVEGLGVYIGALEKFKNSDELVHLIPHILDKTLTKKFIVVGPGPYSEEIKNLIPKYGERLEYIESMPRSDALAIIRSAQYGFTPVADCGLGFIGDCWGGGTPLVATHDLDGFLNNGVDTMIASAHGEALVFIDELLQSKDTWKKYHDEGIERYQNNYTAKAVGNKFIDIIEKHYSQ